MRIAYIDYETYWSAEHSLTKMNPITYVMHPETEIQSVAIAFDDYPVDVFFGEDRIRHVFSKIDWSDTMIVAHNNAGFDALISAWRFGIKPKAWGCTLAMAKPFYALTVGGSLKKVSAALGLEEKGSLDAVGTKGKKLKDFTPEEIGLMKVYNKHDTVLCREIFHRLVKVLPTQEMRLIDLAIRMTVDCEIQADVPLLESAMALEIQRKNTSLLSLAEVCGVYAPQMTVEEAVEAMRPIVMSQPQFALLLERLGAEVPMKESNTPAADGSVKMIPALAKTDKGLESLLAHYDERVALAAATRMEVKSTQLETRLNTFINVATACGGKLPMPVSYCGAAISWRMSGGMKMNVQNLPRVDDKNAKPSDALRQSLVAPKGKVIVVVDSSNIELRVAHGLAGAVGTLDKLRNGEDLYCWFASQLFGRTITKKDTDERFIGKVAMLSLQYGASWAAFQSMVRVLSKGTRVLDENECRRIVTLWRMLFPEIAGRDGLWRKCDSAIVALFAGDGMVIDKAELCWTVPGQQIMTPAGHWLQYPGLRKTMNMQGRDEWKYGERQNTSRIYGSMLMENLCLSVDTNVLTPYGWKRIVDVGTKDLVWDGAEWVCHDGLVYKGVKNTINFGGVRMTPNHEVLIDENWIKAEETNYQAATSSFNRHYGIPDRIADGSEVRWERREEDVVGGAVRLRYGETCGDFAHADSPAAVMRLHDCELTACCTDYTRDVIASSVCGISQHARQMLAPFAQGVGTLWRSWDSCVQAVAEIVSELLGRHGRHLPAGADARPHEKQSRLQQSKLPVGYTTGASPQHTVGHDDRHTARAHARVGRREDFWGKKKHSNAPGCDMAGVSTVRSGRSKEIESRQEPVYDLTNAGPNHRFTVRGADGKPFLVHNCQHIARLIVMEQTLKLDRHYPVKLSCHDEAVFLADEDDAEEAQKLAVSIFSTAPKWWADLPLAAEAGAGRTYAEAK